MELKLGNKSIDNNHPVFIIAELSANHLQNFDIAVDTIKAIKESGADAVKLQTYTPDTITIDSDNEYFQIKQDSLWDGRHFISFIRKHTPHGNGNQNSKR